MATIATPYAAMSGALPLLLLTRAVMGRGGGACTSLPYQLLKLGTLEGDNMNAYMHTQIEREDVNAYRYTAS